MTWLSWIYEWIFHFDLFGNVWMECIRRQSSAWVKLRNEWHRPRLRRCKITCIIINLITANNAYMSLLKLTLLLTFFQYKFRKSLWCILLIFSISLSLRGSETEIKIWIQGRLRDIEHFNFEQFCVCIIGIWIKFRQIKALFHLALCVSPSIHQLSCE